MNVLIQAGVYRRVMIIRRAVVEAWPTLPEAVKAGILAMVEAASGGRSD